MTREDKLAMLDNAREQMRDSYNKFWETGGTQYLQNAAHFAAVMTALLADL